MQKYSYFWVFVCVWLCSNPIHAETLLELYQLAEQHDPQLKIANSERQATLEKKPQARATLLPQVSLSANVNENWRLNDNPLNDGMENSSIGYNVSLKYALYRRDRQIQLEQVDNEILRAEAIYVRAQQELIERLASSYFAVLAANDNTKFAFSAKKAFKRQADEAQQRFEVGLIAITDVQEAQAGYDLAVADEILARNELDNAHEELREITGSYHKVLAILSEDAPLLSPNPADIDTWTEYAIEQNPRIKAAQYQVASAHQEVAKQRAANLPTLDLVGQHSYDDVFRGDKNPLGDEIITSSVGIQFNYQLYEGGAIRSRIKEARLGHVQALDRLEQLHRTVQSQTRQAFLSLLSNISRVKALEKALLSTETAFNAIRTGFELGTRTSVDVVNAQRDLLRAQRNYSQARYNYVIDTLRLKLAAGLLSKKDLIGINNWLTQHRIELQTEYKSTN